MAVSQACHIRNMFVPNDDVSEAGMPRAIVSLVPGVKPVRATVWCEVQAPEAIAPRVMVLVSLPPDPKVFLTKFPDGGRIYRIFWMHCWHPDNPDLLHLHWSTFPPPHWSIFTPPLTRTAAIMR